MNVYFSNFLKTTISVFGYSDPNMGVDQSQRLFCTCYFISNRSNTRKSVSSGYPNCEKCVEKRGRRPSFSTTSRCLDILMKHSSECLILCKCFITYPNSVSVLTSFVFSSWIINEFEIVCSNMMNKAVNNTFQAGRLNHVQRKNHATGKNKLAFLRG